MALATASIPASTDNADRSGLFLLTAAHLMNDINQGVLPAMIPWLVTHRGLSLALAATLTLAANLFGSIVQPLFGYISDKRPSAWVIPVSIFLATGDTALIGFAPTLPMMLAGAVVSGIGVAAFHPESSRFSNYFAGRKRASGMSTFTVGGYLGFAVGPIVAAPLILAFGLPGVAFLLIPAAVVAGLLVRELPRFNEVRQTVHRVHRQRSGSDDWRGFSLMGVVVALRSTTFLAAVTFTPVFIMRVSGVHAVFGSFALFALLLGGAIGTMYGGRLADRIDRRRVITLSLALTAVFGALLALCGTYFHAYAVMTLLALGFGVSLGLSAGVLVVLGQEYLPKHIGVASGVTLGLANTIGGLAAPAFGKVGDDFGLVMVYVTIAVFAVLAFGGTFLMPKPQSIKQA
jgi:FSR family fosmidomycin resistance protein-like MFS transporter